MKTGIARSAKGSFSLGAVLVLLYALHCLAVNYVVDDAYIGFRFIRHLLDGNGLVYNPGERVEGYTNFLWLLFLAAPLAILPEIELIRVAQTMGVAFGAATILTCCAFPRIAAEGPRRWALLAALFLAVDSSFVAWSTSGLETVMFAFWVLAGSCAYVACSRSASPLGLPPALFSLASMTRPEGLLFFVLTSLHFFVSEWRRSGWACWPRLARWTAVFLLLFGSYFVARYLYYGYPFPNTFYAKAADAAQIRGGLEYARGYLAQHGAVFFLPLLFLLFRRQRRLWQDYFVLLVAPYLAYVVAVGGDGLAFFRFMAHVAPLLYLLLAAAYADLFRLVLEVAPRSLAIVAKAAMMSVVGLALAYATRQTGLPLLFPAATRWYEPQSELYFPGDGSVHRYRWFDNYFVDRQAAAARWLDRNLATGGLVASTPAGAVAYYMNHRVIDMLGLNDLHIARTKPGHVGFFRPGHMKGDGGYVLSREPDVILLGNVAVFPKPLNEQAMAAKLVRKSEHELWADPRFHERYELVTVRLADEGALQYFSFYRRRDSRHLPSR